MASRGCEPNVPGGSCPLQMRSMKGGRGAVADADAGAGAAAADADAAASGCSTGDAEDDGSNTRAEAAALPCLFGTSFHPA